MRTALRDARPVRTGRKGNTDPAWVSLAIRVDPFEGGLARMARPKVRRHYPTNPKRPPRTPRLLGAE